MNISVFYNKLAPDTLLPEHICALSVLKENIQETVSKNVFIEEPPSVVIVPPEVPPAVTFPEIKPQDKAVESKYIIPLKVPILPSHQDTFSIQEILSRSVYCNRSGELASTQFLIQNPDGTFALESKVKESLFLTLYSLCNFVEAAAHVVFLPICFLAALVITLLALVSEKCRSRVLSAWQNVGQNFLQIFASLFLGTINLIPCASKIIDTVGNFFSFSKPECPPHLQHEYLNEQLVSCAQNARENLVQENWLKNEASFCYKNSKSKSSDNKTPNENYWTPGTPISWKENNKGLFVLTHGLNGHPSIFDGYRADIDDRFQVVMPRVPQLGDCTDEEAYEPILKMVEDYIEKNPGKPITLIGVSNGSLLSAQIETKLRERAKIKTCCIAGPFFGSERVEQLDKIAGVAGSMFHPAIREKFNLGAKRSRELIEKMENGENYEFIATLNDQLVPNTTSSLPNICKMNGVYYSPSGKGIYSEGPNVRQEVAVGFGHSSIVQYAQDSGLLERCYEFMAANQ